MHRFIPFLMFGLLVSCVEHAPNPHAVRHLHAAVQAMHAREPELARRHLELALQYDPREARALSAMGVLYSMEGEMRKAAWFFEEAIRLRPDLPEAHANLGALLLASGKLQEAARQLGTALYQDPGNDTARWNLAILLIQQKKYRAAAVHLGWYCARTGHPPEAVKLWVETLRAAGDHARAARVARQYFSVSGF